MKTAELTGGQLDYWVAKAEGAEILSFEDDIVLTREGCWSIAYEPSTDWAQGGPIIERERIDIEWESSFNCQAMLHGDEIFMGEGDTMLIAAMRAYVLSKFGKKVPDA